MHPEIGQAHHCRLRPLRTLRPASDGKYASLDSAEEVFEVGINRAVSLIAE